MLHIMKYVKSMWGSRLNQEISNLYKIIELKKEAFQ